MLFEHDQQCREAISIHALREEGDPQADRPVQGPRHFYPRPPRGGRRRMFSLASIRTYFYPRPPRGGRRLPKIAQSYRRGISIHALREEGDQPCHSFHPCSCISIHALREEGDLVLLGEQRVFTSISIHALREEGDYLQRASPPQPFDFYPRPPRGGRLLRRKNAPVGGLISIHALREEGDHKRARTRKKWYNFYPRPPRGGRPATSNH